MKRWAVVVAALYGLTLLAVTLPFILISFAPKVGFSEAADTYRHWQYWFWLAIMVLSQFLFLSVRVRVKSWRPVARRALWPAMLIGGLMAGGLVAGAGFSLLEYFSRGDIQSDWIKLFPLGLGVLVWIGWTLIFAATAQPGAAESSLSRQCQLLFRGSILELLIAVPTHLVARSRDYCCAGLMTFIGLTLGASVMLFSFGPGVFVLYAARWRRLHPKPPIATV